MMMIKIATIFTNGAGMTELLNTTGKRVERLRKDRDWNQGDLAKAVNVRQNYISAIENDKATPSAEVMAAIAKKLETTLDFLMLLTDDPARPDENHKPTYLYEETERAARLFDAIASAEVRAQALQHVIALYESYQERAGKERHIRELLALLEASNGLEYRKDIERRLGLRSTVQSGSESFSL